MKRLLTWIIKLQAVLLLPIIGALYAGSHQPNKFDVLHFELCALPCWNNIIPEKSTVGEAKQQVSTLYGTSSEYRVVEGKVWVEVYGVGSDELILRVVFLVSKLNILSEDVVEGIEIQSNVSIGDAIIAQPTIDRITLWGKGGGTLPVLLYSDAGVIVTIDTPILDYGTCIRIRGHERVQAITINPKQLRTDAWNGYLPQKWVIAGACHTWSFISDE